MSESSGQQGLQRLRWQALLVPGLLLILIGLTLLLRTWSLNSVPPWLWWDEATQGLDARSLLHGNFQVFFPRALGKEPLFIYLSTPFVAAWDGQPVAVRLAGALLGTLMVPVLYVTGRALWRSQGAAAIWGGLAAAGFWATNFWPQSINRIGFQVNALPVVLTLAVAAWLNWTHRPTRQRALTFGLLAGLTLATYLAARVTPLLWLLLFAALPRHSRQSLMPTLPWALAAMALAFAPLAVHFLLNPQDAVQRVSMFANLYQAPTPTDQLKLLADSLRQVVGGFLGLTGDPIPRHNIPNRAPFSPVLGALFALGILIALARLRRQSQAAWTLLLWWAVLCLPSVLGANSNPHFPRLLGALPAALLLAASPVVWLAGRSWFRCRELKAIAGGLLALFLLVEGVQTSQAYFVTWAKSTDLYTWFQGDVWSLGRRLAAHPGTMALVPMDPDSADGLEYAFGNLPIQHVQVDEATIPGWLGAHLPHAGEQRVAVPVWHEEPYVYADPQELLPFYLNREGRSAGSAEGRGYDLLTFTLGPDPQFTAAGRRAEVNRSFGPDLTLVEARWGAAYPNPDRNASSAAAGTPLWVVLTWDLRRQASPNLRVALDLVDPAGHRLQTAEQPLMSANLAKAGWQPGQPLRSYLQVNVPPTQPPGPLSLEARVYDSETLVPMAAAPGTARLSAPIDTAMVLRAATGEEFPALNLGRPMQVDLAPDVKLLGLDPWPATVAPGQTLSLRLFWKLDAPFSSTRAFTVGVGSSAVSATVMLPADLPAGSVIHTYADLHFPPDAPQGDQAIVLASAGGETPGTPRALGQVNVAGRARQFEPPKLSHPAAVLFGRIVALLGADAPSATLEVLPGQAITLTLAWQALSTPQEELVRFVHVLGPDGLPVAQRDSAPCEGACPAPSWLPGEVLVEQVRFTIPEDIAAGSYPLAVGWYSAATLKRLTALDEAGQKIASDLATLPVRLVVGTKPSG